MTQKTTYIYWSIVAILLILYFTIIGSSLIQVFYFVAMLLPLFIATSDVYIRYIVEKYLLKKQYFPFFVYTIYTIIISLYFVFLVIFISVYIFSLFQYETQNLLTVNIANLCLFMFLCLLIYLSIYFIQLYTSHDDKLIQLKNEANKQEPTTILVRYNRENFSIDLRDIVYIESLSDYIIIHVDGEQIKTKEKISHILGRLPESFLRTHRSFIINRQFVSRYTAEKIVLGDVTVPISRTYKTEVWDRLHAHLNMN